MEQIQQGVFFPYNTPENSTFAGKIIKEAIDREYLLQGRGGLENPQFCNKIVNVIMAKGVFAQESAYLSIPSILRGRVEKDVSEKLKKINKGKRQKEKREFGKSVGIFKEKMEAMQKSYRDTLERVPYLRSVPLFNGMPSLLVGELKNFLEKMNKYLSLAKILDSQENIAILERLNA